MKVPALKVDSLLTDRLILIPYTVQICNNIINGDYSDLTEMGFIRGKSWPDDDVMESLPRIVINLSEAKSPTGFESWMIIKNDTLEVIGDAGFKGYNYETKNADIGYGIIKEERRKGYAEEAVTELIKWAFSNTSVKEVTASCLLDNISSINLLQKLLFIETSKDHEMLYWSLQKKLY